MAQSGIPVPADGAEFPCSMRCWQILATINRLNRIFRRSRLMSPILISFRRRRDRAIAGAAGPKLGSATDPEEGAALAVAIAGHFAAVGCMSVISTHHTSLKVYAANTGRGECGSGFR